MALDKIVERSDGGPYDPNLERRVARVEDDVHDMQGAIGRLETSVADVKGDVGVLKTDVAVLKTDVAVLKGDVAVLKTDVSTLKGDVFEIKLAIARIEARLEAILPNLATKADLAEKPSKTYMWGVLTVLLAAYACGLAAVAVLR